MPADVGLVVIGRNEGERLRRCLRSAIDEARSCVYVDSGSKDGSVQLARALGADVVELDMSEPFTAARARNSGLARLREISPGSRFVQFVDGDCELVDGWLAEARDTFEAEEQAAMVCGRLREIDPGASVYNLLCDLEWRAPEEGATASCGGIVMARMSALAEVGGFASELIAGEEPELCFRLRQKGWRILRLGTEMARHDASMTRFRQWWRRNLRNGFAYAEGALRHGRSPERYRVRETRSNWIYGLVLPATAVLAAVPTSGFSLLLLVAHVALFLRVLRQARRRGFSASHARLYSAACVIGKLPQALGQAHHLWNRIRGGRRGVLDYK